MTWVNAYASPIRETEIYTPRKPTLPAPQYLPADEAAAILLGSHRDDHEPTQNDTEQINAATDALEILIGTHQTKEEK